MRSYVGWEGYTVMINFGISLLWISRPCRSAQHVCKVIDFAMKPGPKEAEVDNGKSLRELVH